MSYGFGLWGVQLGLLTLVPTLAALAAAEDEALTIPDTTPPAAEPIAEPVPAAPSAESEPIIDPLADAEPAVVTEGEAVEATEAAPETTAADICTRNNCRRAARNRDAGRTGRRDRGQWRTAHIRTVTSEKTSPSPWKFFLFAQARAGHDAASPFCPMKGALSATRPVRNIAAC